ncbi:MAG: biopolymer transporter ExbD [Desulfuromonadaceae bacterium GWC2_58_13]|nr:MAG: biopolymer transporter ExbD [Desulfuromonadaceae bacterium GWC2_58_13]
MAFQRKRRDEPKVDMTPMVDVVFLLLIFFMISTTFIETPGLSIKLPESSTQVVDKEPEEIKIYLSQKGEIFLGESELSAAALKRQLEGYGKRADTMTFLLLADKEARHGQVVELMDMAKVAGFSKLAIATEQRKK